MGEGEDEENTMVLGIWILNKERSCWGWGSDTHIPQGHQGGPVLVHGFPSHEVKQQAG